MSSKDLSSTTLPKNFQSPSISLSGTEYVCCSQTSLIPLFTGYGFDRSDEAFSLYRCSNCQTTQIVPTPNPELLKKYYQSEYYGDSNSFIQSDRKFTPIIEALVQSFNRSRAKYLVRFLKKDALRSNVRVLDIGCGRGSFLNYLNKLGYSCFGTDISEFKNSAHSSIRFYQGELEELNLESKFFDAISIWHVLEHTLNPDTTLSEISRIIKPRGIFSVAVPHFGSWQSQLFGRHWFHLDLPRHIFHFNEHSLKFLLEKHGFEMIGVSTLSLEQNIFGWIQSALNVVFYRKHPNGLFSFLKRQSSSKNRKFGLLFLLLSMPLFLPALIDTAFSSLFERGGTLIIYARKKEI